MGSQSQLYGGLDFPNWPLGQVWDETTWLTEDFDFDESGSLLDEVERAGCSVGKINDAVRGFWAVVVDGDADGFSVAEIGDAKFCAAGKFAVGGGKFAGGIGTTAGGLVALERRTVKGCVAAFGFGFFGRGFWCGVLGRLRESGQPEYEQAANGEMTGPHFRRVSRNREAGERKLHGIREKHKKRQKPRVISEPARDTPATCLLRCQRA